MDNASPSQKTVVPKLEKKTKRVLLANTKLESSETMPQMDVVTPITTVPVVNPSTPTTTTPTYNPVPTTPSSPTTPTMTPITNPYTTPTTSSPSSSGQSWCIASQTASQTALQVALDYACGYGGADCSQIQPGATCYDPNTVRDHASYAFNDYYQKNPIPSSCDFGGTAIITNTDPSTSTCHYASTSTSSSVLNTTNPTGSDVFGSVPPSPSGTTSTSTGLALFFTLACLLMSPITSNVYK
ncbi:glucan endo-1,3-beta-glucosidase 12 [Cocos nucifera]|nr:glucan endo-1,3-beta-glucosidase 12 [Cocos nucifera]